MKLPVEPNSATTNIRPRWGRELEPNSLLQTFGPAGAGSLSRTRYQTFGPAGAGSLSRTRYYKHSAPLGPGDSNSFRVRPRVRPRLTCEEKSDNIDSPPDPHLTKLLSS